MKKCKCLSLNVRGLRDPTKRRSIFSYLKDQGASFNFFYKKPIQRLTMNLFGKMNGEGKLFFLMGAVIAKECAF